MSCNCKRSLELQDKYGVDVEESIGEKVYRYIWKVLIAFIALGLSIVVVPVAMVIIMYSIIFGDGKPVKLPNWLAKYLT
jgi:hypothetical protein